MPIIQKRHEKKRGCGYRKKGGIYFVTDQNTGTCYKLPIPLTVCPCCSTGIKPTRGFTWINTDLFQNTGYCAIPYACTDCPAIFKNTKIGLLWIGEKYYSTPEDFTRESNSQGISRRISQVPKNFEVGKTWIALAHRKTINSINEAGDIISTPGIFSFFRPQRIEYIVTGNETNEQLEALGKRGFTLIEVIPDTTQQSAF